MSREETGPIPPAPNNALNLSLRMGRDCKSFQLRAMPLMIPSIPSVTRNDGIRTFTAMSPLTKPTSADAARAAIAPARNP